MRTTTQQSDLRARARAGLLPWSFAALAGLAAGACFNPPSAAVMFACDPVGSSACPAGYTCRDDGCCHKDGTDDPADDGACKLGGGGATSDATSDSTTATGSTGSTGAATSATTAGTTDTGGTSIDTGSSSSSTGPQTTGTT